MLQVPVNENEDPDCLMYEVCDRLEESQSQLQELWGKVEELRFERDYNSISEQYKRGNDDCIEYVLQLIDQLQED